MVDQMGSNRDMLREGHRRGLGWQRGTQREVFVPRAEGQYGFSCSLVLTVPSAPLVELGALGVESVCFFSLEGMFHLGTTG